MRESCPSRTERPHSRQDLVKQWKKEQVIRCCAADVCLCQSVGNSSVGVRFVLTKWEAPIGQYNQIRSSHWPIWSKRNERRLMNCLLWISCTTTKKMAKLVLFSTAWTWYKGIGVAIHVVIVEAMHCWSLVVNRILFRFGFGRSLFRFRYFCFLQLLYFGQSTFFVQNREFRPKENVLTEKKPVSAIDIWLKWATGACCKK